MLREEIDSSVVEMSTVSWRCQGLQGRSWRCQDLQCGGGVSAYRIRSDAKFDKLGELFLECLVVVLLEQSHVISDMLTHYVLAMDVRMKLLAFTVVTWKSLYSASTNQSIRLLLSDNK